MRNCKPGWIPVPGLLTRSEAQNEHKSMCEVDEFSVGKTRKVEPCALLGSLMNFAYSYLCGDVERKVFELRFDNLTACAGISVENRMHEGKKCHFVWVLLQNEFEFSSLK